MSAISHTLITGVTQSGKTTLAREIARGLAKKKQDIVVYDPNIETATAGGGWPEGSVIITDPIQFENYMNRDDVSRAHVFVDEADEIFSHELKHNVWMLKKGRHYGLAMYVMTQRPKMVAPTVRNQCSTCYMFRLATADAKEICADFGHNFPEVITNNGELYQLDKGDFLVLNSGSAEFSRANIFSLINSRKDAS